MPREYATVVKQGYCDERFVSHGDSAMALGGMTGATKKWSAARCEVDGKVAGSPISRETQRTRTNEGRIVRVDQAPPPGSARRRRPRADDLRADDKVNARAAASKPVEAHVYEGGQRDKGASVRPFEDRPTCRRV